MRLDDRDLLLICVIRLVFLGHLIIIMVLTIRKRFIVFI